MIDVTVAAAVHVRPHTGRGPATRRWTPDEKAERRKELEDAEAFLSKARIEAPAVAGVGDPAEAIVDEAREEEPLA
jgi:hypothetical protein